VAVDLDAPKVRVALLTALNSDLNVYLNSQLLGIITAHSDLSATIPYSRSSVGQSIITVKSAFGVLLCNKTFVAVQGKPYTVYLLPSLAINAVIDIVITEDYPVEVPPVAFVRILHAFVSFVPNIDLYVNGKVVLADVEYSKMSGYASLGVGVVNLQVRIAGTASVLLELKQVTLLSDNYYTFCIYGESRPFAKLIVDSLLHIPKCSQFRVIHLSESLIRPQIVSVHGQPLLSLLPNPLSFSDCTNFVEACTTPLELSISTVMDSLVAEVSLDISSEDAISVYIIGSKYSSSRALAIAKFENPTLNVNFDIDLATRLISSLNLDVFLEVNNDILGFGVRV